MIDPGDPLDEFYGVSDDRPSAPRPLTPEEHRLVRGRQRSGARIMGLLLAALAILVFLITIAKQVKM